MSDYLNETPPSFYDTERGWYCTIGDAPAEWRALAITRYCKEHGDKWQPVPREVVHAVHGRMFRGEGDHCEMLEQHLVAAQRMRLALPGPPNLIRSERWPDVLQLVYPNGDVWDASHKHTADEIEAFDRSLAKRGL